MLDSINGDVVVGEVIQPETEKKVNKNISYRGTDFERTPDSDSFDSDEKKNKTGKVIGITASIIAAAALILGAVCYSKGKGADGVEKKFGERMKDGWKELWHKGEGVNEGVNKAEKDLGEKANDIKNDAEQTIDKAKEEVNGSELKEKINQAQPETRNAEETVVPETVQTPVTDSVEGKVVKPESEIKTEDPAIREVEKPVAKIITETPERSFEDIAKEAKEYVVELSNKVKVLEDEFAKYKSVDDIPGDRMGDSIIQVKGQVKRVIHVPNGKIDSVTYYDTSLPNLELEKYCFNDDCLDIYSVFKRGTNPTEVIWYLTENADKMVKNTYSKHMLFDNADLTRMGRSIERVSIKTGQDTELLSITKYDKQGKVLESKDFFEHIGKEPAKTVELKPEIQTAEAEEGTGRVINMFENGIVHDSESLLQTIERDWAPHFENFTAEEKEQAVEILQETLIDGMKTVFEKLPKVQK